jgi:hypothetical protein
MSAHGSGDEWVELARAAEERHRAADEAWVDDMVGRVRRGRRVRAAGAAGASLAVVAAVVVGASTLGGPEHPAPPPATRTSPAPSPTPSPTPSQAGVAAGWSAREVAAFGPAVITGAVEWRGSLVAVGCDVEATTVGGAAELPLWFGSGESWQRATYAAVDAPAITCVTGVAATQDGLVAVAGSVVLRSDDGLTWTPATIPDGTDAWYTTVVATGRRVTVVSQHASQDETTVATQWTSDDTRTWEGIYPRSAAGAGADPAETFDYADVHASARLGSTVVLVGASPGGQTVPTAAAWRSSDASWTQTGGPVWQPATVDQAEGCTMTDVVPWRGGLVAAGWCQDTGGPALWTSTDGATWTRVAAPDPLGPVSTGWTEVLAVASLGERLVLAGIDHGDGLEGGARLQWVGTPEGGWERADDLVVPLHQVGDESAGAVGFWPAGGLRGTGLDPGGHARVLTSNG